MEPGTWAMAIVALLSAALSSFVQLVKRGCTWKVVYPGGALLCQATCSPTPPRALAGRKRKRDEP
jgi:hypothetical protein